MKKATLTEDERYFLINALTAASESYAECATKSKSDAETALGNTERDILQRQNDAEWCDRLAAQFTRQVKEAERMAERIESAESIDLTLVEIAPDAPDSVVTLRLLEAIEAFAQQHGRDSEPEHEVGDLQELASIVWAMLTPEQRVEAYEKFRCEVASGDAQLAPFTLTVEG